MSPCRVPEIGRSQPPAWDRDKSVQVPSARTCHLCAAGEFFARRRRGAAWNREIATHCKASRFCADILHNTVSPNAGEHLK